MDQYCNYSPVPEAAARITEHPRAVYRRGWLKQARCFSLAVGERRGGGRLKQLAGVGISSILTADERRYTQIKVNTDLNSDYTTERQYNQICLEYLRSSAFICGLNNFINFVFQQPWRYPTTPRCHRPHHRTPARRLSQSLAEAGALCLDYSGGAEGD